MKMMILLMAATASLWAAVVTYSYDDAGRLTKVDYGNGSTITYTYDSAGNLVSKTVTGGSKAQTKGKDQKKPSPASSSK